MLIFALFVMGIFLMASLGLLGIYDVYLNGYRLNKKGKFVLGIYICVTFGMAIMLITHMHNYYQDVDFVAVYGEEEISKIGEYNEWG